MRIGKSCVRCIGWTYANWICVWGIIALLGVVVGCGTKGREFDGLEAVGKSESALQGGAPAGAGMEDLHAVARLVIPGNAGYCTATLIADRVILTAAHCLTPFGSGCRGAVKPPDDTYVQFADADGDPNGPGSEKIRVLGYAVHPNAWGSRVKDCGIPNPPYTRCFDFMPASEPPSCNLIEVCANDPTTVAAGLHTEHDLAIGFLAKKPTNSSIAPIPVITSNDFLSSGPWVESFLSSGKYVTHVGYGEGSTEWNGARGRDMGTAPVIDIQTGVTRRDSCNGNNDVDEIVPSIVTTIAVHEDAYIDSGDSGGPVLAGPGPVVGNMTPPSILPIWMEQRRHVIGVHSTGSQTKLTGTVPCSSSEPCESGLSCWKNSDGNYRCQIECTTDVDCPPDGRCGEARDGIKGCFGIKSYSAPTYIPENGDWIHEVLERNDIDLDGKANEDDNCPGVPNPDQVNSNFEAERDRQADKLGDACDPVPTPRVSMGLDYSLPQQYSQGCSPSLPYWEIHSRIQLEFIGSHNLINGAEVGQQDQLTEFRFCQENPQDNRYCSVDNGQRTDPDFDTLDNEFSIWRDITIT
ncbi:MAG: hypothetical protein FWD57_16090, partial [Polyangiaceae bacterium]|nr:hypothetical protein [Polyangiaceae bacterium]